MHRTEQGTRIRHQYKTDESACTATGQLAEETCPRAIFRHDQHGALPHAGTEKFGTSKNLLERNFWLNKLVSFRDRGRILYSVPDICGFYCKARVRGGQGLCGFYCKARVRGGQGALASLCGVLCAVWTVSRVCAVPESCCIVCLLCSKGSVPQVVS